MHTVTSRSRSTSSTSTSTDGTTANAATRPLTPSRTQSSGPSSTWRAAPSLDDLRGAQALQRGHRGPAVEDIQRRLNEASADGGEALSVDGKYGPRTEAAVRSFQAAQGLTVDGRLGAATLAALERVGAAAPPTPTPRDELQRGGGQLGPSSAPRHSESSAPGAGGVVPRRGLRGNGPTTPTTTTTGATPSRLTPPAGLSAAATTRFNAIAAGEVGPESQRALTALATHPRFQNLDTATQRQLLDRTLGAPSGGMMGGMGGMGGVMVSATSPSAAPMRDRLTAAPLTQARQLLESSAATRLGTTGQRQLAALYAVNPSPTVLQMAGVGGAERFSQRDTTGGTALSSLHAIATGPIADGIDRRALVASTMQEVLDRTSIEQWGQGTCAATSVSLRLAEQNPAEYARLVAGLATPNGRVALANGEEIARNRGSIADTRSTRTQSERLLQDSFMGFANGDLNYDVVNDTSRGDNGGGGLNLAEVTRLQSAVFNTPYRTVSTSGRTVTRDAGALDRAWNNIRNNLDRVTFRHDPNSPMVMLQQELGRGRSAVIGMRWGQEDHSAHAVVVNRIDNGRVYFENPHGNRYHGQAVGSTLEPPPRRVEEGNVQSMTIADFQTRMFSVSTQANR